MTEATEEDLLSEMGLETPVDSNAADSVKDEIRLEGPHRTSPEWNDWVMSLFEESELFDGRPVCAGLRRVAELVLGPILSSKPVQVFPPTSGDEIGRSTVVWEVIFHSGRVFGDVADCWEGNTDDTFCVFGTATASTRAEGRALRKALGVKTVAAEEMTSKNTASMAKEISNKKRNSSTEGEYDNSGRMTDPQANFIDLKAKQLDVNVTEFFKTVFKLNVSRKIDKKQASDAIEKLNEYQGDKSSIPDSIISYQSDWRSS
jgi:hypothetical protein